MNPLGSLIDIVPGTIPADLQTAVAGDYISLKNCDGVLVVFLKAVGTGGDDPTITVQQATTITGTSAKNVSGFIDIYKKEGALLTGVGAWTKVSQAAATTFVATGGAALQGLYAAWVPAFLLDVTNGFDCLQVSVNDTGSNAQLGCVLYILCGLRYPGSPASLPNSIIN